MPNSEGAMSEVDWNDHEAVVKAVHPDALLEVTGVWWVASGRMFRAGSNWNEARYANRSVRKFEKLHRPAPERSTPGESHGGEVDKWLSNSPLVADFDGKVQVQVCYMLRQIVRQAWTDAQNGKTDPQPSPVDEMKETEKEFRAKYLNEWVSKPVDDLGELGLRQLEWDTTTGDVAFGSANRAVERHNREIASAYKRGYAAAEQSLQAEREKTARLEDELSRLRFASSYEGLQDGEEQQ